MSPARLCPRGPSAPRGNRGRSSRKAGFRRLLGFRLRLFRLLTPLMRAIVPASLFASDLLEEPGARKIPVIIDGGQRNPQNLRYLLIAHPSEIPQFDQFGLNGIFEAKDIKHFVHGQQLNIRARSSELKFLKLHTLEAPAVTLSLFAPSTIYQDVAHRLGRSRKKMRAVPERRILGSHQPQPSLMHQGSRLKRLPWSL